MSDLEQMLSAIDRGDPNAGGELLLLIYDELRRLARDAQGQTLQATALAHEA